MERSPERLVDDLRELIEALDRRVPQLERLGESQIAADAARLKKAAEARLAVLEAAIARARGSS